jgi:hypothetical protein
MNEEIFTPIEFYLDVIEEHLEKNTIFIKINNIVYYYLCWNEKDKIIMRLHYTKKYSEFIQISKEEFIKQFKPLLRREKLIKIKEKIK